MVQPYHSCLISDTGKGVLYTSDADGIVFSESLRDHVVSLMCFLWRYTTSSCPFFLRVTRCMRKSTVMKINASALFRHDYALTPHMCS